MSVTTAYDGYGRLTQYIRGTEALSFQYNGRDDRVAMTSASAGVRRFVYDPAGRVIGEYGASAADVKAEFIWLSPEVANDNPFGGDDGIDGYAPLAVATPDLTGTVQLNWVHSNHLGVPLVTTDASGQPATTPNDYLAPGFPGQARVLADLYYNRYRDYDPTTGRYIQADPIGLAGGGNPYLYAGGNPMGRVDPFGWQTILITEGWRDGSWINPWGHSALSFTGKGLYSFGNDQRLEASTSQYINAELKFRNIDLVILDTTPEQEAAMAQFFRNNYKSPYDQFSNNCANLTLGALRAGGVLHGRWLPSLPLTPGDVQNALLTVGTGRIVHLRHGGSAPEYLTSFDPGR